MMPTLEPRYNVKKRNVLNEIKATSMTLTELRFFSIYLSKIHVDKPEETRTVRFPLDDFKAIMDLSSRINVKHMQKVTNSLLCKVVNAPIVDENGKNKGYTAFQLFKECTVSHDESGEWYVEIDAHDKALPLMFNYKNQYFSYRIDNILRLRSPNQLRMYEVLKQYENTKEKIRIISVDDLKEFLGISKEEYPRFGDFKTDVLNVCQKALAQQTDIKFTYEPYGKRGQGGKILNLKFFIEKNEEYSRQMTFDMFIEENRQTAKGYGIIENDDDDYEDESEEFERHDNEDGMDPRYRERIDLLTKACNSEFSFNEIVVLYNKMRSKLPDSSIHDDVQCYDYLMDKYHEMIMRNDKTKIKHRFNYLCSIIEKDSAP